MDININLVNKEDLVNKFNNEELNTELGDYIYQKAIISKISRNKFFRINIKTDFEINTREEMLNMVRSYYGNKVKEELLHLKREYIKNSILFIIGIILLILAYFTKTITDFVLPEILIIVGWLAIWEMAYGVVFSGGKHRLKVRILKKLTKCKIIINEEQ